MARTTITVYTDDLTGAMGDDISTHLFSIDGVSYEIDLAPEGHQKLRDALAPFVEVARRAGGGTPRGRRPPVRREASRAARIREWARSQGIEVNARGLVRQDVVDQYEAATADR
ncbi:MULTISPECIES: histone-like nucleoid-structuring protein Lsr2 [Streptomyces]|uniref:Lsr2 family protein n=1 Tax=Streptomyces canarius TaxID=285453 RepID=A0ABQ3DFK6_9ACTN|nr:Lsr2 family protein [Streptomyces canarius]GHA75855.1 Lsr2 family protein [Streptomyces canarius]